MIKLKNSSIKIKILSNNIDNLISYVSFLKHQLIILSIPFTVINLPKYKTKFTLFRSPHVHKKSKEHFGLHFYNVIIYLECSCKILKYIQFNLSKNDVNVCIIKI